MAWTSSCNRRVRLDPTKPQRLSDHIFAKNSVGSDNLEMGSSSGLRSRSHARLASWQAKHV